MAGGSSLRHMGSLFVVCGITLPGPGSWSQCPSIGSIAQPMGPQGVPRGAPGWSWCPALFPVLPPVPVCPEPTSSSWFAWGGWRPHACGPDGPGYSPSRGLIHSHPAFHFLTLGTNCSLVFCCLPLHVPSYGVCSYLYFITALQWVFETFRESLLNEEMWGSSSYLCAG